MLANLENSAVAMGLEKGQFSFQSQRKAMPKILKLPHNCTHLTLILQVRLQQYVNWELQMCKLDLEKAEEPEVKSPTSVGSLKKAREFQKIIYFCFTDYAKALDCVEYSGIQQTVENF